MSLEDRVNELEKLLQKYTDEVTVQRHAVADISRRLAAAEKAAPAARRPSTHNRAASDANSVKKAHSRPGSASTKKAAATPPVKRRPVSGVKKSSSRNKVLAARTDDKKDDDEIDPKRTSKYRLGKSSVKAFAFNEFLDGDGNPITSSGEAPPKALSLSYAYGYNGTLARDNVFFNTNNNNEIIYCVAAVGVVTDISSGAQRHFLGHNEDIVSLAVHPSKPLVATGQRDPKGAGTPFILIWDHTTCKQVAKITYHERAVQGLSFTEDGKYLISFGAEDSHDIAFWDWEKSTKKPVAHTPGAKAVTYGITAGPKTESGEYQFVTFGEKLLEYYTFNAEAKGADQFSKHKCSTFGNAAVKDVEKAYNQVAFINNKSFVAVGRTNGAYLFEGSNMTAFKGYKCSLGGVVTSDDKVYLVADNGTIYSVNDKLEKADKMELKIGGKKTRVTAVTANADTIVIGTSGNRIFKAKFGGDSGIVVDGHSDEVWGLAVHPDAGATTVVSGAMDKTIKVWDFGTSKIIKSINPKAKSGARSISFSPDGAEFVVGFHNGHVAAFDSKSFEEKWDLKVAGEQVDAIAYSPDGKTIAAASWDQAIHLLTASGKKKAALKGHTGSVVAVSWSEDSNFLQSNSRDYEILYWDVSAKKRVNTSAVADAKWAGWSNFLGYPVQGIWRDTNDGTDINAVDKSGDGKLLAAGDDSGIVRLYNYPCTASKAKFFEGIGHSSHVANVRWAPNDQYLFSAGGADSSLLQWSVKND